MKLSRLSTLFLYVALALSSRLSAQNWIGCVERRFEQTRTSSALTADIPSVRRDSWSAMAGYRFFEPLWLYIGYHQEQLSLTETDGSSGQYSVGGVCAEFRIAQPIDKKQRFHLGVNFGLGKSVAMWGTAQTSLWREEIFWGRQREMYTSCFISCVLGKHIHLEYLPVMLARTYTYLLDENYSTLFESTFSTVLTNGIRLGIQF